MLRIVIFTLIVMYIGLSHALAFDLDMTVDDDIRKNYNSSKLINDTNTVENDVLPELPAKLKYENVQQQKFQKNETYQKNVNVPAVQIKNQGTIKIPSGTVFNVVSQNAISDWQKKGTALSFKLKSSVVKKNFAIPAGTIFTGEILESHQPQITCNGGLVVIRINGMKYNGSTVPLMAYVQRANGKNIFFNDIKGKRTYLKTVWKKGNWGRSVFNYMLNLTINFGGKGSTLLFSPFPFMYGTICLGLNTLTSPICAFFNKGGHVSIPAGSSYRIKLMHEAYVD